MIRWKDEFSVEVPAIDNQHKRLFEIAGIIYDLSTQKKESDKYDELLNVIDELKDYTVYHFKFEEDLMKKYGYSDYDTHKIEHDFFVKKIQKIERKDLEGAQNEAIVEIISFVTDWISSHILHTDKKYEYFFKDKGVQ